MLIYLISTFLVVMYSSIRSYAVSAGLSFIIALSMNIRTIYKKENTHWKQELSLHLICALVSFLDTIQFKNLDDQYTWSIEQCAVCIVIFINILEFRDKVFDSISECYAHIGIAFICLIVVGALMFIKIKMNGLSCSWRLAIAIFSYAIKDHIRTIEEISVMNLTFALSLYRTIFSYLIYDSPAGSYYWYSYASGLSVLLMLATLVYISRYSSIVVCQFLSITGQLIEEVINNATNKEMNGMLAFSMVLITIVFKHCDDEIKLYTNKERNEETPLIQAE
jgi:hypothetical protein